MGRFAKPWPRRDAGASSILAPSAIFPLASPNNLCYALTSMSQLLTRDEFREAVFKRDGHKCVICEYTPSIMGVAGRPGLDAHHIIERRLWPDGGYYLDNGATLCSGREASGYRSCHMQAEATLITPSCIRAAAGISKILLPPHLYQDQDYDKWGNPYVGHLRMRGELFDDPSVQKALTPVLGEFTDRIKYPRTYHLPWSPGVTSDDRIMTDLSGLEGQEAVVTLKMDGEQTTIYSDGFCHARSIDSKSHESRNWVKALAANVGPQLPQGWRICGENLYAKHSILYKDLPSYFLMFSIWDGLRCLSWKETEEWAQLLGLHIVQPIERGIWNTPDTPEIAISAFKPYQASHEGYVVRVADSFHYKDFRRKVGKYVRASHVHTHGHWMREQVTKNRLKDE